jgi:large subunit ribosomal protein L21
MFALVRTGGRQYKISPGEVFKVDRMAVEPSSSVVLDEVLLVSEGDEVTVGTPLVDGANVACTVVRHERGPKIRVFRFKAKKGYRKRSGQRRELTVLRVDGVSPDGKRMTMAEVAAPTKAAAKPKAKAKSKAAAKPEAKAASKAAAKPKAKAKSKAAAKPKAKAKSKAAAKSTAKPKAAAKPKAKSKAKASAKTKSKAKSKSKASAKAKSKSAGK